MRSSRPSSRPWRGTLAWWAGAFLLGVHGLVAQESLVRAWLRSTLPAWNDDTQREADAALTGTLTLQGVTGTVPRHADGGFDWTWRGPKHDPEFAWFLNRQHHVPALFVAWRETRDQRYRKALNEQLRDWLRQNPKPAYYSLSSSWRALEVARRVVGAWMPVLFAPEADAAIDPDVRAAMLASIPDHAAALHHDHSLSGNHLVTEMTGLAVLALAFPDFKDAPQWLDHALAQSRGEIARAIYPDGAQKELSNLYQRVVLLELQKLADVLTLAGREEAATALRPALEDAWSFYAHTLDPRGHGPLNNDSSVLDDAALVREIAAVYRRPDWLYIATNGREGTTPSGFPSDYFPYAGLAVMRGGSQAAAQWAFFDMGPHGAKHQHADRLHLSLGGGGREFLVDGGRYNYQPGPWRDYFAGPRGHNVLLLDGQSTLPPPNVSGAPVRVRHEITKDRALFGATAPFAGDPLRGQGPAYHTRTVLYVRDQLWIVSDQILCAGAHEAEILWHFAPDCIVKSEGSLVYTANPGQANLALMELGLPARDWKVALIRGRETPSPQGWYSRSFNQREPATCVSFRAALSGPRSIVWIIWIAPPGRNVVALKPATELVLSQLQQLEAAPESAERPGRAVPPPHGPIALRQPPPRLVAAAKRLPGAPELRAQGP